MVKPYEPVGRPPQEVTVGHGHRDAGLDFRLLLVITHA